MKKNILILSSIFLLSKVVISQECQMFGPVLMSNGQQSFAPPVQNCPESYTLEFEDDFNGSGLDFSKWDIPYQGAAGTGSIYWWANSGTTPSISYSNNIEVSNGTLKLIAKRESPAIVGTYVTSWNPLTTDTRSFNYSSAQITSKKEYGYGIFEIRCRVDINAPIGNFFDDLHHTWGLWPTFWTFGGNPWREIDIMDNGGNIFDWKYSVHYLDDPNNQQCPFSDEANFLNWHTLRCVYTPMKIDWYLDGTHFRTVYAYYNYDFGADPISCTSQPYYSLWGELLAFPHGKMNIITSMQLNPGTPPIPLTAFPASLEIDYIKYWKRNYTTTCNGSDIVVGPPSPLNQYITRLDLNASNSITTLGAVDLTPTNTHDDKHWQAEDHITLNQGFSFNTSNGGTFMAELNPCASHRPNNQSDDDYSNSSLNNNSITSRDMPKSNNTPLLNENIFDVFPNPAQSVISISLNELSNDIKTISIYTSLGDVVFSKEYSDKVIDINVSQYPRGIYTVKVVQRNCVFMRKIVLM
jgi:beta-glucanase (GH16 family)